MVKVFTPGLMVMCTMESGSTGRSTATGPGKMLRMKHIWVSGKIIWHMATVFISGLTVIDTKDSGQEDLDMDQDKTILKMVIHI